MRKMDGLRNEHVHLNLTNRNRSGTVLQSAALDLSANPSVRSSFVGQSADGHLTVAANRRRETNTSTSPMRTRARSVSSVPQWRRQLRSRMFRTTALVVLAHMTLWMPYNVIAVLRHVDEQLSERLNEQFDYMRNLIVVNAVLNPFLYGITGETFSCCK